MSLNISSESTNLRKSEEKRYGNLVINTTFREEKGVIDLRQPISTIQNISSIQRNNTYQAQGVSQQNNNVRQSQENVNQTNITFTTPAKLGKNLSIRGTVSTNSTATIMRGQKISINSKSQNLSKLLIALDWDVVSKGSTGVELDTSLFMVDTNGKTAEEDFIFYGNPRSKDGALVISGDYNSGIKTAYDESIELNLNAVKMSIEKLAITVTVFEGEKRNQNFSQLSNAYIRIIDVQTKRELLNYRFDEGLRFETAVVVAEIYRYKNEWKINPIGNGFTGGLEALCSNYGIKTE